MMFIMIFSMNEYFKQIDTSEKLQNALALTYSTYFDNLIEENFKFNEKNQKDLVFLEFFK